MARFRAEHPDVAAPALVVSGGVAANRMLRQTFEALSSEGGFRLSLPPPALCTDNAAMVAWAGAERLARGLVDGFDAPPGRAGRSIRKPTRCPSPGSRRERRPHSRSASSGPGRGEPRLPASPPAPGTGSRCGRARRPCRSASTTPDQRGLSAGAAAARRHHGHLTPRRSRRAPAWCSSPRRPRPCAKRWQALPTTSPGIAAVVCAKGIERGSRRLMSEVLAEAACLAGASLRAFGPELCRRRGPRPAHRRDARRPDPHAAGGWRKP
jgi:hypothetical protein